jgi:hypothetical protein
MIRKSMLCGVTVALAISLGALGCGKSGSSGSGEAETSAAPAAGQASGMEREAQDAALAEIGRHWVKGADGWTSAITSGSPYAPDHFLRQFRQITVEGVQPAELSDSDRMNGFEWAGEVSFKRAPCREAGDPGIAFDGTADIQVNRQRGQWTQWVDYQPWAIKAQKVSGKWQIDPDTTLLRGQLPTPQDYASAGAR